VSDDRIRVRWSWTDEMLEIEILDPGRFQPSPGPAQLPEPLSEGGRGMFVISSEEWRQAQQRTDRQLGADLKKLQMFITIQLAFLPHESGELIFASAGHCPLLKFSPGVASATQSHGGGVPLGVMEEVEYESHREPMTSGDRVVLLSDGIYEERNRPRARYSASMFFASSSPLSASATQKRLPAGARIRGQ
jgi:serine phosphatase RsbU (regulator of sigma subunit)